MDYSVDIYIKWSKMGEVLPGGYPKMPKLDQDAKKTCRCSKSMLYYIGKTIEHTRETGFAAGAVSEGIGRWPQDPRGGQTKEEFVVWQSYP